MRPIHETDFYWIERQPNLSPERMLWIEVIKQALIDLHHRKRGSAEWFFTPNLRDFYMVCDMAGVTAGMVMRMAKNVLSENYTHRAPPRFSSCYKRDVRPRPDETKQGNKR